MQPKLTARLWVQAALRRCDLAGIAMVVVRRGDADAGAILVKLNQRDLGCTVFSQMRTADGRLAWMRGTGEAPVPEEEADAYVARQLRYDDDLWVLEVDDRAGRLPFDDAVL